MSKNQAPATFEPLLKEIHDAGLTWIDAQLKARQLEEDQKSFLAALKNDYEKAMEQTKEKITESKLDRLALGSVSYRDYILNTCTAWAEAQRFRVRYDNLQMVLEARRSELAMERAKIEKGIFHQGS